jgi:nitrogen permease regulator 3-like protein
MNALWQSILSTSSLAKGMSEVYHSIASSKIAHVIINNSFDVSLQIPIITETSVLPSIIETQMPGLWLTTANSFDDDESVEDNMLAKHFALLFLDDVSTILKEIETEPKDLSGPLAHYVRCSKPTMSFLQVSIQHDIPLTDIQILARHLIYWRRARAIPPLHHRDTYIVSPNADMKGLRSQSLIYARTFPTLPSLPKILSMLSGKPRPYGSIIPSKDHRQAYLEILAWLVRGGWVTQLRTFAWVYVCKNIKIEVAQEMAREEATKSGAHASPAPSTPPPRSSSSIDAGPPDIRSGYLSPPGFSDASSVSSNTSTVKPEKDDPSLEPSIILEPHKANALECRWLEKIAEKLEPEEARMYFPVFTKYFNGQHALEKIAVRENLTRKDVRRLLAAMDVALIEVRHW